MNIGKLFFALVPFFSNCAAQTSSEECALIDVVMTRYLKVIENKFHVCRNERVTTAHFHMDLVNKQLAEHFSPAQAASFLDMINKAEHNNDEIKCNNSKAIFTTKEKAKKIYSKYGPNDDWERLHKPETDYTVYIFSTPVFYGEYASITCFRRSRVAWTDYDLFLFKKEKDGWKIVTLLDSGMLEYEK